MQLSNYIGTFLSNYDVTNKKLQYDLMNSILRKQTKRVQNSPMETTQNVQSVHQVVLAYSVFRFVKYGRNEREDLRRSAHQQGYIKDWTGYLLKVEGETLSSKTYVPTNV